MSKLKFEYNIRGYRYAPESFHIYKGLPGQKKDEISLSDEQRQKMGYLCLTEGVKSAVDYVKHIERERERKCRQYMTYGFMLKDMISVLGILPNGEPVADQSTAMAFWMIILVLVISLAWFAALSFLTARWFEKKEVG